MHLSHVHTHFHSVAFLHVSGPEAGIRNNNAWNFKSKARPPLFEFSPKQTSQENTTEPSRGPGRPGAPQVDFPTPVRGQEFPT